MDRYASVFLPRGDSPAVGEPFGAGEVRVTYLGTSTLLFDDGTTQVMIDGFISRPSMSAWGALTGRVQTDTAVVSATLDSLGVDRLKALFVVHTHHDHALDAAFVAARTEAVLYGSESTLNVGRGWGLAREQLGLVREREVASVGAFEVRVLASRHGPQSALVRWALGGEVDEPLRQPARVFAYREGGAFDVLVRRDSLTLLVKASPGYVPHKLDDVRADVLFLGIGGLGRQDEAYRDALYEHAVTAVRPRVVVPIHWDDFRVPLAEPLRALPHPLDDVQVGMDFIVGRTSRDSVRTVLLGGGQTMSLRDSVGSTTLTRPRTHTEAPR